MGRPKKIETADSIAVGKIETTPDLNTDDILMVLKEIRSELRKLNSYFVQEIKEEPDNEVTYQRRYVIGL